MYQCHIQFYLSGNNGRVFDIVKKMPPLENFIHDFSVSEKPDRKLASEADVILADLQGLDAREIFQILVSGKSIQSELILLADSNQITLWQINWQWLGIYGQCPCRRRKSDSDF